jgi:hypothetical protein
MGSDLAKGQRPHLEELDDVGPRDAREVRGLLRRELGVDRENRDRVTVGHVAQDADECANGRIRERDGDLAFAGHGAQMGDRALRAPQCLDGNPGRRHRPLRRYFEFSSVHRRPPAPSAVAIRNKRNAKPARRLELGVGDIRSGRPPSSTAAGAANTPRAVAGAARLGHPPQQPGLRLVTTLP